MASSRIQARVDTKLLKNAEKILNDHGVKIAQAITMFLTAVKNQNGFSFLFPNDCPCSHEPNEQLAKELHRELTGNELKIYNDKEEFFESLGL
ncbi:hypothetical protein COY07_02890 [Candidatus Peregrinibacteria bacterium CG_4_10_14_0_2_um_filter_43_11]|nr:MAG: hypothetical protein COY07_02890 [Candidatus Peregrinibacteria bacterium CG_4_10_14_0_2_um_filter_43_11]